MRRRERSKDSVFGRGEDACGKAGIGGEPGHPGNVTEVHTDSEYHK